MKKDDSKSKIDDKGIADFDKLNPTRQMLASTFISLLESNESLSWIRGWSQLAQPENAITHRKYNGINKMILSFLSRSQGYNDSRWCTFKQANEKGWKIKKGEKATPVEFWFPYDKAEKKQLSMTEYYKILKDEPEREKDIYWKSYTYYVFNAQQMTGVPEIKREENKFDEIELAENFLYNLEKNLGVEIIHKGDEAYYSPSNDNIHMPLKTSFKNEYDYYATALHEFSHSTGAEKRLNRDIKTSFGTEKYAKEELRAEISSCFLSNELNLNTSTDTDHQKNHLAYVQNWIQIIKEQPKELFKAINDADTICNYLIKEGELEKCRIMNNLENSVSIEEIYNDGNDIIGYKFVKVNEENRLEFINDTVYPSYSDCKDSLNTLPSNYQFVDFDTLVNILSNLSMNKKDKALSKQIDDFNKEKPIVTINWSEHPALKEGQTLSLKEADTIFAKLDKDSLNDVGYYKTSFTISYKFDNETSTYTGRQDFGDGDGGLIDHMKLISNLFLGENWLSDESREGWLEFKDNVIPYFENCIKVEKSLEKQITNNQKILTR